MESYVANVRYDYMRGIARLAAVRENLDAFAVEVLELHTALEIEIDTVLSAMFPRAGKMLTGKGRLSFPEKVSVLNATWSGDPLAMDALAPVLISFIDLRNNVAHPDRRNIDKSLADLRVAYRQINHRAEEDAAVLEIAQGICAMLGDGPNPTDLKETLDALGAFANGIGDAAERKA